MTIRLLTLNPNSRTSVQMLDNQAVENIFYYELQSNCAACDEAGSMALYLHARARIHMSGTENEGLAS